MKNSSFQTKKNSRRATNWKRIGIAFGVVVCAVLSVFVLKAVIGSFVSGGVGTFYRVHDYFAYSTAVFPTYVRSKSELIGEIEKLRGELSAQSGNMTTVARLEKENEELRALFHERVNERILAGVLARPPFVPYDLLVIDRGAEEGVVVGAVVYIAQNHAIGLVSHVYDHTSLVTLFTSPGVETTVYVYGPNVFAYAYGEGGGVLRVSLPQGVGIHEGDPVVLPALRMGDVGLIERVESLPTQPEQSAYVTLPQSLQSIRMVSIDRETLLPPTYTDIIADSELLTRQTKMLVPESALQVATSTIDGVGTTTSTTVSTIP